MKLFAQLDQNNVVINISTADESWDSTGWIEYFETDKVVIGGSYENNHWILPQPYPSWTLDENYDWQAPVPYPEDGLMYFWNEESQDWEVSNFN